MTPDQYWRWFRSYEQASHQMTLEGINALLNRTFDRKRDRMTDDDAVPLSRASKRQHVSEQLGFHRPGETESDYKASLAHEDTSSNRTSTMSTSQPMPAERTASRKLLAASKDPVLQLHTEGTGSHTQSPPQIWVTSTTWSHKDKLRMFFADPPAASVARLQQTMKDKSYGFAGFENGLSPEQCWLDEDALRRSNNRTLRVRVPYRHDGRCQSFNVAYGVVALFLERGLTEGEVLGLTDKPPMQLSHLCGNWHCCNPKHMVIESGRDNRSRNRNTCLTDKGKMKCGEGVTLHCPHWPECMVKHRLWKADLIPIGMRRSSPALTNSQSSSD